MKKIFALLTAFMFGFTTLTQTATASNYVQHLTKSGKPDKRYNDSKHLKKDGTMDMRYKSSKKAAAKKKTL
ncbi:MAG: hypothetical protein JWP94_2873 [Mucilaginibacter sp.]|nr:hypothetical protein [Mucilaginibacter sp.]